MKFFIYLSPLIMFLISCGEYKKNDCDNDCTPRELSTPYYNLPLYSKLDLQSATVASLKDYLIKFEIVKIEKLKNYDENDIDNSKYIQLDDSSMLIVNPSQNPGKLKSIDYLFPNCNKISKKDLNNILKLSNFLITEKYDINSLFNFVFEKDEISTNQVKLKTHTIAEASCDPIDYSGQFHIYRE
ncbi:hypothetical protein [Acinetobacter bereziniae]|uniref:hypothetical protein n=1 Tax=Acinetobacter bereziniae TaxID=106648 RepID=UPI00125FEA14|nr:hypothetical protein [Acinetobacter bereziniae]